MIIIKKNINAHAKINLFLKVLGLDATGALHLIKSLFLKIPLADYIEIEYDIESLSGVDKDLYNHFLDNKYITCEIEYGSTIINLPSSYIEENIVITAIKKFLHNIYAIYCNANKSNDIKIIKRFFVKIKKNIPISSGMGGGSADAAAVLNVLYEIFKNIISKEDFYKIVKFIGSDVPFAVSNKDTALVSGTGNIIEGAIIPNGIYDRLLLVNTGSPVKTAEVYAEFDTIVNEDRKLIKYIKSPSLSKLSHNTHHIKWSNIKNTPNDLTEAACNLHPELKTVLSAIKEQNGCMFGKMSGSGGTCFGIFTNKTMALRAAHKIICAYPEWWVYHISMKYQ